MSTKPCTILIIEDNPSHSLLLEEFFAYTGYQPTVSTTGEIALDHLSHHPVDVALVDLNLPDIEGVDLIKKLRQTRPYLPLVIWTAHPTLASAVVGIRQGVRDYLIKPCSLTKVHHSIQQALHHHQTHLYQEILAHIRQNIDHIGTIRPLLTDRKTTNSHFLTMIKNRSVRFLAYGPLRLDLFQHIATIEALPLETTPTEFGLLAYLVYNAPCIISPTELFLNVWTVETSTDDINALIRRSIYNLRQKIRALGCRDPIQTKKGIGYQIQTTDATSPQ